MKTFAELTDNDPKIITENGIHYIVIPAWEQEGENGEALLDSELISSEFNRMLFNLEYHYKKDLAE